MTAGEIFRHLRKKNNLTQKTVGKLIGISTNHVACLERDERTWTIPMIKQFCDIFGVSFTMCIGLETVEVN